MPLINCDISLNLTWYKNRFISPETRATEFAIADINLVFLLQLYQPKIK